MLQNIKQFYGKKLGASDGEIGHVKDFYFDDKTWVVRYLVADTGTWLSEREVLISPHSFGTWDESEKIFRINLKRKQIENSPSPDLHQPVSRQYEVEYYQYYGLPTYWEGTDIWGLGGYPMVIPPDPKARGLQQKFHHRADKHLHSTHAVKGYQIQASDGAIGHIIGFLVDDAQWTVHDLVVETGHWYSGKEVRVPTTQVERVSFEDSKILVNLTQADIRQAAEAETAQSGEKHSRH